MKNFYSQNRMTGTAIGALRTMAALVMLSLLIASGAFAQSSADYQARLNALLAKKDVYKTTLNEQDFHSYQMEVAALQLKLHLPVTIPGAPGYVEPPTTAQQINSTQAQINAINQQLNTFPSTLTKAQLLVLYAQLGILNTTLAELNGTASAQPAVVVGPFSTNAAATPAGVYSFDPNKIP